MQQDSSLKKGGVELSRCVLSRILCSLEGVVVKQGKLGKLHKLLLKGGMKEERRGR